MFLEEVLLADSRNPLGLAQMEDSCWKDATDNEQIISEVSLSPQGPGQEIEELCQSSASLRAFRLLSRSALLCSLLFARGPTW
jgi:hypothetical protein